MRTATAEARRVRRARPPLTIDTIRVHAEAGHTLEHTAFELQVHPSTVLGRLHKAGEEALTDALYANGGRARRPSRRKQQVGA